MYITKENFSEVTQQLHDILIQRNLPNKEVLKADLLLEETFMKMLNFGDIEGAYIKIQRRFGDLSLNIEAEGKGYNPLVEITDYDENDEDYYRTLILKANRFENELYA